VVDLPAGSTPIDFAYHVHTDLGHRCRGAKVDGQMVPLNYKLQNAQRVEIMAAKQGGPSRDWLSPQLGFLASARAPGEGAPVVPARGLREGCRRRPRLRSTRSCSASARPAPRTTRSRRLAASRSSDDFLRPWDAARSRRGQVEIGRARRGAGGRAADIRHAHRRALARLRRACSCSA
jgi:hypothetical protein